MLNTHLIVRFSQQDIQWSSDEESSLDSPSLLAAFGVDCWVGIICLKLILKLLPLLINSFIFSNDFL